MDTVLFDPVIAAIKAHGLEITQNADVVRVQPGFLFANGQITINPAIIVTAMPQPSSGVQTVADALAKSYDGIPVEVRPADPQEQMQFIAGENARSAAPEAFVSDRIRMDIPGTSDGDDRSLFAQYVPPTDLHLTEINEEMTVLCNVSPDAGWPSLHPFLTATKKRLTSTMYEFNAPYIADAIIEAIDRDNGTFKLILDGKAGRQNITGALKNEDMAKKLEDALGDKMTFVWAANAGDSQHVTEGFFQSAYHIKVSVRDGEALWLSSGNWKLSNQPNADPIAAHGLPPHITFATLLKNNDRDWHVIIENKTLAGMYEAFIDYDIAQAAAVQTNGERAVVPDVAHPDLLVPVSQDTEEALRALPNTPIAPKKFVGTQRVQPVLTPDNYLENVIPLVKNAQHKIDIINQYITLTAEGNEVQPLVDALVERAQNGVAIRIILRDQSQYGATGATKTAQMLEALVAAGLPTESLRLLKGNHAKGYLIDDQIAIVGSHNLSGAGVSTNRDASLIFHSPEIAAYFGSVYEFDWENRSYTEPAGLHSMPVVDRGMRDADDSVVRIAWNDWMADD